MEVRLENLIEKIKKEGVDSAKKQADDIIVKAKADAVKIIENAKTEAEQIKGDAKKSANEFQLNAEASVQQAARDTILSLKEKIKAMFERVLIDKTGQSMAFDEGFMKDLVWRVVDGWAQGKEVSVLANDVDVDKLKKMIASEFKKDIEIKLDNKISSGFHVGIKGDDLTYDFTDESIAEALKLFLNPKLNALLS